jgi:hypothetical protein
VVVLSATLLLLSLTLFGFVYRESATPKRESATQERSEKRRNAINCKKAKMNVQSSTEGELVTVNDAATMILWTKLFLEAQGYDVDKNIVYQDNKSAILLETNGKKSSGKRARALNICYFSITNQVEKGNAQFEHCGTNNMV